MGGTTGSPTTGTVLSTATTPVYAGMDLRAMRAYAYALADEAPNAVFPTNVVDAFINRGVKLVARGVPSIPSSMTFTTAAGSALHHLVDPIVEGRDSMVDSVILAGRRLPELSVTNISDRTKAGTPSGYYISGEDVGLYPVPVAIETLVIEYQMEPADLVADSDVPTLATTGRELACLYAAYQMKLRDDEYSNADRLKAQFDRELREFAGPRTGVYKGA